MDRETEALLRAAFDEYDADGDGYITFDEMAEALCRLDPNVSHADIRNAMADSDLDVDGKVSFDEFVKMNLV